MNNGFSSEDIKKACNKFYKGFVRYIHTDSVPRDKRQDLYYYSNEERQWRFKGFPVNEFIELYNKALNEVIKDVKIREVLKAKGALMPLDSRFDFICGHVDMKNKEQAQKIANLVNPMFKQERDYINFVNRWGINDPSVNSQNFTQSNIYGDLNNIINEKVKELSNGGKENIGLLSYEIGIARSFTNIMFLEGCGIDKEHAQKYIGLWLDLAKKKLDLQKQILPGQMVFPRDTATALDMLSKNQKMINLTKKYKVDIDFISALYPQEYQMIKGNLEAGHDKWADICIDLIDVRMQTDICNNRTLDIWYEEEKSYEESKLGKFRNDFNERLKARIEGECKDKEIDSVNYDKFMEFYKKELDDTIGNLNNEEKEKIREKGALLVNNLHFVLEKVSIDNRDQYNNILKLVDQEFRIDYRLKFEVRDFYKRTIHNEYEKKVTALKTKYKNSYTNEEFDKIFKYEKDIINNYLNQFNFNMADMFVLQMDCRAKLGSKQIFDINNNECRIARSMSFLIQSMPNKNFKSVDEFLDNYKIDIDGFKKRFSYGLEELNKSMIGSHYFNIWLEHLKDKLETEEGKLEQVDFSLKNNFKYVISKDIRQKLGISYSEINDEVVHKFLSRQFPYELKQVDYALDKGYYKLARRWMGVIESTVVKDQLFSFKNQLAMIDKEKKRRLDSIFSKDKYPVVSEKFGNDYSRIDKVFKYEIDGMTKSLEIGDTVNANRFCNLIKARLEAELDLDKPYTEMDNNKKFLVDMRADIIKKNIDGSEDLAKTVQNMFRYNGNFENALKKDVCIKDYVDLLKRVLGIDISDTSINIDFSSLNLSELNAISKKGIALELKRSIDDRRKLNNKMIDEFIDKYREYSNFFDEKDFGLNTPKGFLKIQADLGIPEVVMKGNIDWVESHINKKVRDLSDDRKKISIDEAENLAKMVQSMFYKNQVNSFMIDKLKNDKFISDYLNLLKNEGIYIDFDKNFNESIYFSGLDSAKLDRISHGEVANALNEAIKSRRSENLDRVYKFIAEKEKEGYKDILDRKDLLTFQGSSPRDLLIQEAGSGLPEEVIDWYIRFVESSIESVKLNEQKNDQKLKYENSMNGEQNKNKNQPNGEKNMTSSKNIGSDKPQKYFSKTEPENENKNIKNNSIKINHNESKGNKYVKLSEQKNDQKLKYENSMNGEQNKNKNQPSVEKNMTSSKNVGSDKPQKYFSKTEPEVESNNTQIHFSKPEPENENKTKIDTDIPKNTEEKEKSVTYKPEETQQVSDKNVQEKYYYQSSTNHHESDKNESSTEDGGYSLESDKNEVENLAKSVIYSGGDLDKIKEKLDKVEEPKNSNIVLQKNDKNNGTDIKKFKQSIIEPDAKKDEFDYESSTEDSGYHHESDKDEVENLAKSVIYSNGDLDKIKKKFDRDKNLSGDVANEVIDQLESQVKNVVDNKSEISLNGVISGLKNFVEIFIKDEKRREEVTCEIDRLEPGNFKAFLYYLKGIISFNYKSFETVKNDLHASNIAKSGVFNKIHSNFNRKKESKTKNNGPEI